MGKSCRETPFKHIMADYPEFELPEGLDVTDLEEGEEMEVLAKIRKEKDGKACLVELEGFSLKETEEVEEDEDEEPSFEDSVMIRAEQLG